MKSNKFKFIVHPLLVILTRLGGEIRFGPTILDFEQNVNGESVEQNSFDLRYGRKYLVEEDFTRIVTRHLIIAFKKRVSLYSSIHPIA